MNIARMRNCIKAIAYLQKHNTWMREELSERFSSSEGNLGKNLHDYFFDLEDPSSDTQWEYCDDEDSTESAMSDIEIAQSIGLVCETEHYDDSENISYVRYKLPGF